MVNGVCARITIYLRVAVAVLTLLAPPVSFAGIPKAAPPANIAANSNPTVLPPGSMPYGRTYAQWSVLWWQWFLPLTADHFNACTIGQSDRRVAFLLAGPPDCAGTVLPGTSLFFPIANVECSNLESPPFYGATASDRNACAKGSFESLAGTLTVEIDNIPIQNPTTYKTVSSDFTFVVGPDNVFGINTVLTCGFNSCQGQSTGYGYYLMLAPLQPGTHQIHIVAPNYFIDTNWTLTVRR
jgi:hypothetical protein